MLSEGMRNTRSSVLQHEHIHIVVIIIIIIITTSPSSSSSSSSSEASSLVSAADRKTKHSSESESNTGPLLCKTLIAEHQSQSPTSVATVFSVLTLTWGWSVTVIVSGQQVSGSSFNNRHCDQNVQCANINVGMVSGQQESGGVGLTTAAVITVLHNTNMTMITVTCEQEIGHLNNLCSLHLPLCV